MPHHVAPHGPRRHPSIPLERTGREIFFCFKDGLRLSSLLRFNHTCTFFVYLSCLVSWAVFLSNFTSRDTEFEFFSLVRSASVHEQDEETLAATGWLNCPVYDAISYVAVKAGTSGFCASTIDINGAPVVQPLQGCDIDLGSLYSSSVEGAAAYCEELCQCATGAAGCLGFSVRLDSNGTLCRLHTRSGSCDSVLPSEAALSNTTLGADFGLDFAPSASPDVWLDLWNAESIGIHAVDGTPRTRCFAKSNTCTSDCLGLTCDELSATLGLSCDHLEREAGCNCAGCGCTSCDQCLFPFQWAGQTWTTCQPFANASRDEIAWCPRHVLNASNASELFEPPLFLDGMPRMACPSDLDHCDTSPTMVPLPTTPTPSPSPSPSASIGSASETSSLVSLSHFTDAERIVIGDAFPNPADRPLCGSTEFVFGFGGGETCETWDAWTTDYYVRSLGNATGKLGGGGGDDSSSSSSSSSVLESVLSPYEAVSLRFNVSVNGAPNVNEATLFIPRVWGTQAMFNETTVWLVALLTTFTLNVLFAIYHWFTAPNCSSRLQMYHSQRKFLWLSRCQAFMKQGMEVMDVASVVCGAATIILSVVVASQFSAHLQTATARTVKQCTFLEHESLALLSGAALSPWISFESGELPDAGLSLPQSDCYDVDTNGTGADYPWEFVCSDLSAGGSCDNGEVQLADSNSPFDAMNPPSHNIAVCNWDGGDCCPDTNKFGSASCGPRGCDCRSVSDPERFEKVAKTPVPIGCELLFPESLDKIGDGICDACSGPDCDEFYEEFLAPSTKCCSCGGGDYHDDFCVDTGSTPTASGARKEWDDGGVLRGLSMWVPPVSVWACADYLENGVCFAGRVVNPEPLIARWGFNMSSEEIDIDALLRDLPAQQYCCACGGGDVDVCSEANANLTNAFFAELQQLSSVVAQRHSGLCPSNASSCEAVPTELQFHVVGLQEFFVLALGMMFVAGFKLVFDMSWIYVRFKLRTVRGVQNPRCQTCNDTFSFDNLPHCCVQCGFFNCETCCSYRVVLPGLEGADEKHTMACFLCSMLQEHDVLSSLSAHGGGDLAIGVAALVLEQCARLAPVRDAYAQSQAVETTVHAEGQRMPKQLSKGRVVCKLRAQFGFFWHANIPVQSNKIGTRRPTLRAPVGRRGGLIVAPEQFESKGGGASKSDPLQSKEEESTDSPSPATAVVTLGQLILETIDSISSEFERVQLLMSDEVASGNKKATVEDFLPKGLEAGLMDGELPTKDAHRVFGFQQHRGFRAPFLRKVFSHPWRQQVRMLLGQKPRHAQVSVNESVKALHTLLKDKSVKNLIGPVAGIIDLPSSSRALVNTPIPYAIQGVGVAEAVPLAAPEHQTIEAAGTNQQNPIQTALKAFWRLPQAQRDAFLTRIHDDTYFGLAFQADEDDLIVARSDKKTERAIDVPCRSPASTRTTPRCPSDELAEALSSDGNKNLWNSKNNAVPKRLCFQIPECTAFIPNCSMKVEGVFGFKRVNVVVFHDFLCCFEVDKESDDFGEVPGGFLLGRSDGQSHMIGTLNPVAETTVVPPVTPKVNIRRASDAAAAPTGESSSVESAPTPLRCSIGLHVDNLVYYVTFEEIESCAEKVKGGDEISASNSRDCLACLRKLTEPEYRRLKGAAVVPASKVSSLGNNTKTSEASARRFHVRSKNCHAVIAVPLEAQCDVLQKLVADRIVSKSSLLALNPNSATFPVRLSQRPTVGLENKLSSFDLRSSSSDLEAKAIGFERFHENRGDTRRSARLQQDPRPAQRSNSHHQDHRHQHRRPSGHGDRRDSRASSADSATRGGESNNTQLFAQRVQLFTCGSEYFENLAHSLLQARSFIMIRDWKFAPDIYLKRRSGAGAGVGGNSSRTNDEAYRLDNILQKKAREGVLIYIILYSEIAIYTGSELAQARLVSLHSNIFVIRHRSRQTDNLFWSHHEKFVNIDGCITYVGGLDLCHGRYDTPDHPLWDAEGPFMFPGCDYSNPQVRRSAWSKEAFATPHLDIAGLLRTQVQISHRNGVMLDADANQKTVQGCANDTGGGGGGNDDDDDCANADASGDDSAYTTQESDDEGHNNNTADRGESSGRPLRNNASHALNPIGAHTGHTSTPKHRDARIKSRPTSAMLHHRPSGLLLDSTQMLERRLSRVDTLQSMLEDTSWMASSPQSRARLNSSLSHALSSSMNLSRHRMPSLRMSRKNSLRLAAGGISDIRSRGVDLLGPTTVPLGPSSKTSTHRSTAHAKQGRRVVRTNARQRARQSRAIEASLWDDLEDHPTSTMEAHNRSSDGGGSIHSTPHGLFHARNHAHAHAHAGQSGPHAAQQRDTQGRMICRMPWHDTHCSILGMPAMDTAKCFVQAWNAICGEIGMHIPIWPYSELQQLLSAENLVDRYQRYVLPKRATTPAPRPSASNTTGTRASSPTEVNFGADVLLEEDEVDSDCFSPFASPTASSGTCKSPTRTNDETERKQHPSLLGFSSCNVQVLRSLSAWSGWRATEASILKAYLDMIKHAERFVYIENQFFMTASIHKNQNISNAIGAAIQDRVVRAIREGQAFKVVILLPSHHDGPIETKIMQTLLRYMQNCLTLGTRSLLHQINSEIDRHKRETAGTASAAAAAAAAGTGAAAAAAAAAEDLRAEDFISILSLHRWQQHPHVRNYIGHSQIYVHSKLLLVDDKHLVIGSANINDRSMLGTRDSELAVKVDEVPSDDGIDQGCLKDFRMRLWGRHFGVPVDDSAHPDFVDLSDPTDPDTWAFICKTAEENTTLLESVFEDMPSNKHKTYQAFFAAKDAFQTKEQAELRRIYGDDFTTQLPHPAFGATDDEALPTDSSPGKRSSTVHPEPLHPSSYDDHETEETKSRLEILNRVRGHVVTWPGEFAAHTELAEIKDSTSVRVVEIASRGFFL